MSKAIATEHLGFTVAEMPHIIIRNPVGVVDVVAGEANLVSIRATREARSFSEEQAQRDLAEITVSAEQNGNVVTIEVSLGEPFPPMSQRQAHLLVTVPARANLDADVKVGRLHTYGLEGRVLAQVATGKAELRRVTLAEQSRLRVYTGKVELDGALTAGASLDVQVNVGGIALRLPSATYTHLDASARIGGVEISGWPVAVRRHNLGASASGDMSPEPVGALSLQTDVGGVSLSAY